MTLTKKQKNMYTFSQTTFQKFFAKHLEKIIFLLTILILIIFVVNNSKLNIIGLILTLSILNIFSLLYIIVQKKFAYKIIIDFNSNEIKLYLHRSDDVIIKNLESIEKIRVNGYIIIKTPEKNIYYNDCSNIDLLKILNKIKKIEWGRLCFIWGPSKKIRERIAIQST